MVVEKPLDEGAIIELAVQSADTTDVRKEKRKYRAIKAYKHHVLLEDVRFGTRRCITNAELLTRGLVCQKMG